MIIHITVNSFKADIDSDDSLVESIRAIVVGSTDSLETLMSRQVWISQEITKKKQELAALYIARDLASEAYSKFSVPHFTENMGPREKCVDCGKLTSWLWSYKPHCKNNDQPNCFNIEKDSIPLDATTLSLLENFADEK